jgi:recombination protein RecA
MTLETAIKDIREKHGEGAILKLSDAPRMDVEVISTGSPLLDITIGPGGIPRGRITEIYGPESSGKTTLCQHIIAEAQMQGIVAAFIDVEHAIDLDYMRITGVNPGDMWLSQPSSGEEAGDILESLIRSKQVGVVVVDSVAALLPLKESESDVGNFPVGMQARLMSQIMRKISGAAKVSNTAIVFTNQIREKIGTMFGSPETTPGGRALKFYASLRLDLRGRKVLKDGDNVTGRETRVKVVKNKVGKPLGEAMITILHDRGIAREYDLLPLGLMYGILESKGSHIYYDEERIAQGKNQFVEYLKENLDVMAKINEEVMQAALRSKDE